MEVKDPWDSVAEFTLAEIREMESIYKEIGDESLDQEFCQQLATSFSGSSHRIGKSSISCEQVHAWFHDKRGESKPELPPSPMAEFAPSSLALKLFVDLSDPSIPNIAPQSFKRRSSGDKVKDLTELAYEARSSRDFAWYDVATFLSYRVLSSGEIEARVRFAGFSNKDDEWVDVRTAVRERSVPLEPSECDRIKVGDMVMCFREREYEAVYRDAHVMDIQKESHDNSKCTCTFVIRFYHDDSEEHVHLGRICCIAS